MRPFLKWLGNKYRVLNEIKTHLPECKRLIEPFAGSAAVFLNTSYSEYLLGEQNPDLINLYQHLSDEGEKFILYAKRFFQPKYNCESEYYLFRDKFNTTKNKRLKAALFLYLNRHGYNGLCRYNSQGIFNVPFGRYAKPYFPYQEMLHFAQKANHAKFIQADFSITMSHANKNDVIYCDPPYLPISESADFTAYTGNGFNAENQSQLVDKARELANKEITVIISNHDTPAARELYHEATLYYFPVSRTISAKVHSRVPVKELIAIYKK